MVPVTIDGEQVKLATISYKPEGNGPFPVLIFHHGSTGGGTDPAGFATPYEGKALAAWFKARGWAVVLPSRRGRGGSEGLYDEGFFTNRELGYTCEQDRALAGADRALRDIDAATAAILAMPFVDRSRFAVGGISRGGILSVAWSGRGPDEPRAVINFVGGWLGTGCPTSTFINQSLFKRGVTWSHPSIWLYGEDDPFYPLSYSRENFSVFQAAGGKGTFHQYKPPAGFNGHQISVAPALWETDMEAYLEGRGLPAKAN